MKEVAVEHQKAGADMKEVVHMKAMVPLAVDHQKAGAEMKAHQVVAFDTYFTQV